MMRLPVFEYTAPASIEEAIALLLQDPQGTRLVAGGTDLWPNMKRRHQSAERVISLRDVPDLHGIERGADGSFRIGAMTTLAEVAEDVSLQASWPGVASAAASVASPTLRNMGTLGGNLCLDTRCTYYNQNEEWREAIDYCLKERGKTCWVAPSSPRCWAVSSTDTAPMLCAAGASVEVAGSDGARTIPLPELYADDGISYLRLAKGEILTRILLPGPEGRRSTYWKLRRRGSIDFPVLGVGATLRLGDGGVMEDVSIFLGAVTSCPTRAREAEAALEGRVATPDVTKAAGLAARGPATPLDNTDFTLQWRRHMVAEWVDGAIRELAHLDSRLSPGLSGHSGLPV